MNREGKVERRKRGRKALMLPFSLSPFARPISTFSQEVLAGAPVADPRALAPVGAPAPSAGRADVPGVVADVEEEAVAEVEAVPPDGAAAERPS